VGVVSDRHLLYIVGEPASGKSTVVEAMTAGIPANEVEYGLLRWRTLETEPKVIELGMRRDSFSGTDALAMNVQPDMVRWLANGPGSHVLAEGDRLANLKFFIALKDAGWRFHVACVEASPLTLAQRRNSRAFLLGVPEQSDTWVKGRQTKLRNLMYALPKKCVSYHRHDDGAMSTATVISELVAIDPVAQVLQRGVET
jgi:ABC-type dipeptide/oligopeptide/nickel transport system ATPase component